MIESEVGVDGRVHGRVVCGNVRCKKTLRTFEGEENEPGPSEIDYRLLSVTSRVLYEDDRGDPLRRLPIGDAFAALGVDLIMNLDDRIVGYRASPGSAVFAEDFCSDRCASEFLKHKKEYGICCRMQPGGSLMLVAQMTDRFPTEQVRVARGVAEGKPWQPGPNAGRDAVQAKTHIEAGRASGRLGKTKVAIRELEAALRIEPDSFDANHELARVYTSQGRMGEAIHHLRIAISIEPGRAEAHLDLGLAYAKKSLWSEATLCYQEVVRINSSDARAHYRLGQVHARMSDLTAAVSQYEAALSLDPRLREAAEALTEARVQQGEDRRLLQYYGKTLELQRSVFSDREGEQEPMEVPMDCLLMACAMERYDQATGQIVRCNQGLQIPLNLAPSAVLCPFCFGLLFIDSTEGTGQHDGADFNLVLAQASTVYGYFASPDHRAQDRLGLLIEEHTSGGQVLLPILLADDAIRGLGLADGSAGVVGMMVDESELRHAVLAPSGIADFILQSATTAYEDGRYRETVALAQRALVIDPESASAHLWLARASDELGMLDVAVREYRKCLEMAPRFASAYNDLAVTYSKQDKLQEAVDAYRAAIRVDSDLVLAHRNFAELLVRMECRHDALFEYQEMLRIAPEDADARHNAGVLYLQIGRYDLAVRELRIAAQLNPDDGQTHDNLGNAYYGLGQIEEAKREYQTAIRLGYAPARQSLARIKKR